MRKGSGDTLDEKMDVDEFQGCLEHVLGCAVEPVQSCLPRDKLGIVNRPTLVHLASGGHNPQWVLRHVEQGDLWLNRAVLEWYCLEHCLVGVSRHRSPDRGSVPDGLFCFFWQFIPAVIAHITSSHSCCCSML